MWNEIIIEYAHNLLLVCTLTSSPGNPRNGDIFFECDSLSFGLFTLQPSAHMWWKIRKRGMAKKGVEISPSFLSHEKELWHIFSMCFLKDNKHLIQGFFRCFLSFQSKVE